MNSNDLASALSGTAFFRKKKDNNDPNGRTNERGKPLIEHLVNVGIATDPTAKTDFVGNGTEIDPYTGSIVPRNKELSSPPKEDADPIYQKLQAGVQSKGEMTKRYSFEIYPSLEEDLKDFIYHYEKKTKERLSASQLIREAIKQYLEKFKNL